MIMQEQGDTRTCKMIWALLLAHLCDEPKGLKAYMYMVVIAPMSRLSALTVKYPQNTYSSRLFTLGRTTGQNNITNFQSIMPLLENYQSFFLITEQWSRVLFNSYSKAIT